MISHRSHHYWPHHFQQKHIQLYRSLPKGIPSPQKWNPGNSTIGLAEKSWIQVFRPFASPPQWSIGSIFGGCHPGTHQRKCSSKKSGWTTLPFLGLPGLINPPFPPFVCTTRIFPSSKVCRKIWVRPQQGSVAGAAQGRGVLNREDEGRDDTTPSS